MHENEMDKAPEDCLEFFISALPIFETEIKYLIIARINSSYIVHQ